ncbi:molybdate ABC transporter substrate-binding protein [Arthrobacter sp. H5]|uniref:molybdate ABC transporter substrate-binding protein n=1 Tax=Arthrobacter sp. H5 TaxID=1267973 RepID=UPI0004B0A00F|nr:molybdate ABC transporter substrate-binding protein [Arthrobacter sp. H5]
MASIRAFGRAAAVVVLLTGTASCGAPQEDNSTTAGRLSGTLTVFAAASLTDTFTQIAEEFEARHPDASVQLSFAGSSDLVTQITAGAPADVFASADTSNMDKLIEAGLVLGAPVDFATNTLMIAVPAGNPAGVTSLEDLVDPANKVVICAPQVPCGTATVKVEQAAGVDISAVSEESSVTDVLGKVTSGEADAGLVYVTDVSAASDAVEGIAFDESAEAVNTYPLAPVVDGNTDLAEAFIELVTGEGGQTILAAAGFGPPSP